MLVAQEISSVEIGYNDWIAVHLGSAPNSATQTVETLEVGPRSLQLAHELCSTPTIGNRGERGWFRPLGRDDGRWTYPVYSCESSLVSTYFTRLGKPEIRRPQDVYDKLQGMRRILRPGPRPHLRPGDGS